ncbi:hypothetical protein [Candidatus Thiosymbion oneisti]|uniref:hypothetical protein n=1 Tax=Candidatus Thiosymbion oneisti TaxID=589554 RepID=UPI00105C22C7|nr:hypothetical protein [Candidatus Thiosymbion oneisti]
MQTIPNLHGYLSAASKSDDYEERACARNFLLDERPPPEALELYKPHFAFGPVSDMDDWYGRHHGFATEQLFLDPSESDAPVTFRPLSDRNRVTQIDERLNLIRVEQADWPCILRGDSFEEVADQIKRFRAGDDAARGFLQGLCNAWNADRDRRPAYVTTEIQVADILADGVADWAVRLRNRLGLGHLDPGPAGRPVEILVMRYPVAEAIAALDGQGHPAIPTMLDGDISNYSFPSPLPKPDATKAPLYGRTVNLTPVEDDNDYEMGCELLSPRLVYRPEHFYRAGIVAEPVTMPLDRARGFHLPWVRIDAGRDDFGADLFGEGGE